MRLSRKRRWFQYAALLAANAYFPAWLKGGIYQGRLKGICIPVLNCYSCPSALGACPIGALQNSMTTLRFNLSIAQYRIGLYVIGFLGVVGSLIGRLPCGWACPFGLLQEIMYKIRSPKLRVPRFLRYGKYLVLVLTVILLPLLVVDDFGMGQTWFCKWICPAGTLGAGIPLAALDHSIRGQLGRLFSWKITLAVFFLIWMTVSKRPFCRTVCPLGAALGLFNRTSLWRMRVDETKCTHCDACLEDCPVDLPAYECVDTPECIRCLKCRDVCPYGAIEYNFLKKAPARECPESR
jgi:polyferredoxin